MHQGGEWLQPTNKRLNNMEELQKRFYKQPKGKSCCNTDIKIQVVQKRKKYSNLRFFYEILCYCIAVVFDWTVCQ